MGIIKAIVSSVSGVGKDAWKDYFVCDSLPADTLMVKGRRKNRSGNNNGSPDVITNGSVFTVADGQAAVVVSEGEVVLECAEPGEHVYDSSLSNSIFQEGGLADAAKEAEHRIAHAGDTAAVDRIYYVNTKIIPGGKFGHTSMPFRYVDKSIDADMDLTVECAGVYSFRVVSPGRFYKLIAGNVSSMYKVSEILLTMNAEFSSVLQSSFAKSCEEGRKSYEISALIPQLQNTVKEVCTESWMERYGIEIVTIAFSEFNVKGNDRATITALQKAKVLADPSVAAGYLVGSQPFNVKP